MIKWGRSGHYWAEESRTKQKKANYRKVEDTGLQGKTERCEQMERSGGTEPKRAEEQRLISQTKSVPEEESRVKQQSDGKARES